MTQLLVKGAKMKQERTIPIVRRSDGSIGCDVCGPYVRATKHSPPTSSREPANYCDDCVGRFMCWPETTRLEAIA
jgi:uncharacterized Zn finger protein (UPF0148 family)